MKVVLIVSLLQLINCRENPAKKLISKLNHYFDFDHNIFLEDSPSNIARYLDTNCETPRTIHVFKSVQEGNIPSITQILSKNTFLIAILGSSTIEQNYDFLQYVNTIQRIPISMKIGVFFRQVTSIDNVRILFTWCKEHHVANVFAAFPYIHEDTQHIEVEIDELEINIFTFDPFGVGDMINVTTASTYEDLFPSLKPNFHQHPLRISVPFDEYVYEKPYWSTIFQQMNASYEIDKNWTYWQNNPYDVEEHFRNGIDVLTLWSEPRNERDLRLYPLSVISFIIIIPEAQPYTDFAAYLRKALSNEILGYALTTVAAVIFVLIVCRYFKQQKIQIFASIVDVLNLLVNNNIDIKYQKLSRAENLIVGPLTFVGFIVVNGILSNLKSQLTSPVSQPQIKTVEEIYNSPYQIITHKEYWKKELIEGLAEKSKHRNWSHKIIAVNYGDKIDVWLQMYKSSASFLSNADFAYIPLRLQKRLKIRGYYNTQIQITKRFIFYHLNEKFLFFERYNEITHRLKSAGLIDLWWRGQLDVLEKKVLKVNLERLQLLAENDNETQVYNYLIFIVYGWTAGGIVFVFEIVWKKFNQLRSKSESN